MARFICRIFGSSDVQTLRIPLYAGQPGRKLIVWMGKPIIWIMNWNSILSIQRYYPNRMPSRFAADVRIGNRRTTLEVNHPTVTVWEKTFTLTGYDTHNMGNTQYCILQIVRQPWKYVMVVGILMMLTGAVLLFINGPKKLKHDNLG